MFIDDAMRHRDCGLSVLTRWIAGKQRKNRSKESRGTAKTKGAKKDKKGGK